MMESQVNYIMKYLAQLEAMSEGGFLNLKPEVQKQYNETLQKKFAGTVWSSGCRSWYINATGKNTTLYPRLSVAFRRKTKQFDPTVYRQAMSCRDENHRKETITTTTSCD